MDISDTSLPYTVPLRVEEFTANYAAAYPNADKATASIMIRNFEDFGDDCNIITNGYKYFLSHTRPGFIDDVLESLTPFFLFYGTHFDDFHLHLQAFMIEMNDPFLDEDDYALLFYASLQDMNIQKTTLNLPLNMLYDMFLPVAEENMKKWKVNE
jgi:hypothetical protein